MRRSTRLVSLLVAASMAFGLCPVSALADNGGGGIDNPAAVTAQTLDQQNSDTYTEITDLGINANGYPYNSSTGSSSDNMDGTTACSGTGWSYAPNGTCYSLVYTSTDFNAASTYTGPLLSINYIRNSSYQLHLSNTTPVNGLFKCYVGTSILGGSYGKLLLANNVTIEDGVFGFVSPRGSESTQNVKISGGTFQSYLAVQDYSNHSGWSITGGVFCNGFSPLETSDFKGGVLQYRQYSGVCNGNSAHHIVFAKDADGTPTGSIQEINGVARNSGEAWDPYVVVTSETNPTYLTLTVTADVNIGSVALANTSYALSNVSYNGHSVTFTLPSTLAADRSEIILTKAAETKTVTLPTGITDISYTPNGSATAVTVPNGTTTANIPVGATIRFTGADGAAYRVGDTALTPDASGKYSFPVSDSDVTLRQFNALHLNENGTPKTDGTAQDANNVWQGNGWSYDGSKLTLADTRADLSSETNRIVSVPTEIKKGTLTGLIFANGVTFPDGSADDITLSKTILLGSVSGKMPGNLHKLTLPAGCTAEAEGKSLTLTQDTTVYLTEDVQIKLTTSITDPEWTIPKGVTLTEGDRNSRVLVLTVKGDAALSVASRSSQPLPAPEYNIAIVLPADADLGIVLPTDLVTVAKKAKESAEVALTFHPDFLPAENELEFEHWVVTDAAGNAVSVTDADKTSASFVMPASDVTVSFTLKQPGTASDEESSSAAAILLGGAVLGGTAYLVGTELWLTAKLPGGVIPSTREQLALLLWNQANCPEPQPAAPYSDISADAADLQQAAHWCVQQGLMKDYREGTAFKPGSHAFRLQIIKAWNALKQAQAE